jgi:hypothetical protein
MVNYSNGKIYKLECRKTGLVYIGSTAQKLLSTRIGKHKGDYKKFLTKKMNYVSSFEIIKNNDYFYDTIEYYECDSKTELERRERFYIEKYKNDLGDVCVNKCVPTRTKHEWYLDNRENILEQKKEYRNNNRQSVYESHQKWVKNNREYSLEYQREYRENNRESIREKSRDKSKEKWANQTEQQRLDHNKKNREYYHRKKAEDDKNLSSDLKEEIRLEKNKKLREYRAKKKAEQATSTVS